MPTPSHRCPFTRRALPPPTKADLKTLRLLPGVAHLFPEPAADDADDAQGQG